MARFKIISKDGSSVKYEGKLRYIGSYLKPSYVEFSEISSSTPINWEIGDYVDYSRTGMRYRLFSVPQVVKNARAGSHGNAFSYTNVQFFAATKELEIALFRDLVSGDNNIHFSTSPDVATFEDVAGIARRIQACMDDLYPGRWEIRVADFDAEADAVVIEKITTAKDFALSGGTCLDALSKIYELWQDIGWIHSYDPTREKDIITIGYANKRIDANTTDAFLYGKGNGLTAIKKSQANKDEFATRLYVYGSERNLPARYYNDKNILNAESVDIRNLMLPMDVWGRTDGKPDARKAYIENTEAVAKIGVIPRVHYFDSEEAGADIYPSIEGMTVGMLRKVLSDMGDTAYSPSYSVYTDASERVDEVGGVISLPADEGKISEITQLTTIAIPSYSKEKNTGIVDTIDLIENHILYEGLIESSFEMGEITVRPSVECTVTNADFSSVIATLTLDDSLGASTSSPSKTISILAEYDESRNLWVLPLKDISVKYDKKSSANGFYIYLYISISATKNNPGVGSDAIASVLGGKADIEVKQILSKTFNLRLKQLGFNLNLQGDLGKGKTISLKTGKCAGRNFIISSARYSPSSDSWDITCKRQQDETLGLLFPNTNYEIQTGDRFVLLDIVMPESYIRVAMERLLAEGQRLFNQVSTVRSNYEPSIDAKLMAESGRHLREGMFMEISDSDIVDNTTDHILIDTLSIYEDESAIPTYKVTLRERRKVTYKGTPSAAATTKTSSVEDGETDMSEYAKTAYVDKKDKEFSSTLSKILDWFTLTDGVLLTKYNLASEKEVSAKGINASQGGGSSYNRLDSWSAYDSSKAGYVLSALLGYDLHSRVTNLENAEVDLSDYYTKSQTNSQIASAIGAIDLSPYATKEALNTLEGKHNTLRSEFDALSNLLSSDTTDYINTWNEVVAFLDGYKDESDLATILSGMNADISSRLLTSTFDSWKADTYTPLANLVANHTTKLDSIDASITNINTRLEGVDKTIEDHIAEFIAFRANFEISDDLILVRKNFASTEEVSAKGINQGTGGGGGGSYSRLDTWEGYDNNKAGYVLSAGLGYGLKVAIDELNGYDLDNRVRSIENSYVSKDAGGVVNGGLTVSRLAIAGGSSSQFLKADGSLDGTSYLSTAGGTINSNTFDILTLDTSYPYGDARIHLKVNGESKSLFGWSSAFGTMMYNTVNGYSLSIKDDGTPLFNNNTLLHTGNIGSYAPAITANQWATSAAFIGEVGTAYIAYIGGSDWSVTDNEWSNEYTLYHSGNFNPSDYLSTSGGTINSYFGAFSVKRYEPYSSAIKFENSVGILGYIGISDDYTPLIWDKDLNTRTLIHSGNVGNYNAGGLVEEFLDDLNNATGGRFFISGFQAANRPNGAVNYGTGVTFKYSDIGAIYQLAYDTYGGLYSRYKVNNSWSNWKTIACTDSDITGNAGGLMTGASHLYAQHNDTDKYIVFGYQTARNGYSTTIDGTSITFRDGGSNPTMLINSAGNVLIGTDQDRGAKLYVNGTFRCNALRTNSAAVTYWGISDEGILSWDTTYASVMAKSGLALRLGIDGTPYITIASNGAISMAGAVTMGSTLTAMGIATDWNDTWSDGTYSNPWYGLNFNPVASIYGVVLSGYYGITLKSAQGGVFLNSNGNVGIGTSSPSYKLDVIGDIRATESITIGGATLSWENGALKVNTSFYSEKEISAKGLSTGGGSGASYNRLDAWGDYDSSKAGYVLSAGLGYDLNSRLTTVESNYLSKNGGVATNLTLYGGTINGDFIIDRSISTILYYKDGVRLGFMGFRDELEPIIYDAAGHYSYDILHSGNIRDYAILVTSNQWATSAEFSGDVGRAYIAYRGNADWSVTDNEWSNEYTLYHSGNFNSADYLPLSGGALTGDLTIQSSNLNIHSGNIIFNNSHYLVASGNELAFYNTQWNTLLHSGNVGSYAVTSNQYGIDLSVVNLNIAGYGYALNGWLASGPAIAVGSTDGYTMLIQQDAGNQTLYVSHKSAGGSPMAWRIIAFTDSDITGNAATATYASNAGTVGGYGIPTNDNKPWGALAYITPLGWMEIGKHIEFHYDNTTGSDYSTALMCTGNYGNIVNLPSASGTLALTTDNVASATKLATPRTIWGQSFDGTQDLSGDLHLYDSDIYWHRDKANYCIESVTYDESAPSLKIAHYGGIDFHTGGVSHMYIDYSGNVGIGTTNPQAKLHVNGVTRIQRDYDSRSYLDIAVGDVVVTYNGYDSDGFCSHSFRSNGTDLLYLNGHANDATFYGSLSVSSTLAVSGNTSLSSLSVANTISSADSITTLGGHVSAHNGFRVNDQNKFSGLFPNSLVTLGGNATDVWMYVEAGKAIILGESGIDLRSATTISSSLSVSGALTANGGLTVNDILTVGGASIHPTVGNPYFQLYQNNKCWYWQADDNYTYIGGTMSKALRIDQDGNTLIRGSLGVTGDATVDNATINAVATAKRLVVGTDGMSCNAPATFNDFIYGSSITPRTDNYYVLGNNNYKWYAVTAYNVNVHDAITIEAGKELRFKDDNGVVHTLKYDSTKQAFVFDGNVNATGEMSAKKLNA